MKKHTRFLSLLLALAMCLSLTPGGRALETEGAEEPVPVLEEVLQTPMPEETPVPEETPAPEEDLSQDFDIQDGVLKKYTGVGGEVVIPTGVTEIGERAFNRCIGLTEIVIPDSVTVIGDSAFDNCTALTDVSFGNGVTTIGSGAFWNCCNLTNIILPDSLGTIGSFAFNFCSGLTRVTIPEGVTTIGPSAFKECSSLTNVVIPDSVTTLGENAFYRCTKLTSIVIGNGVTEIGSGVFRDCSSLTDVTIGNGVTTLGDLAFLGCTSLTHITIPDSVTSLGSMAFWNCSSLTDVDIGAGVTMICGSMFANCTSLTHISIPAGVTEIDSATFEGCTALTDVMIESPNTKVNGYAFKDCPNLKSYTQAGKVVELGRNGLSKEVSYKDSSSLTKAEQAEKSRQEAIQRSQGSKVYEERLAANKEFLETHITERDYIYTIVTQDVQDLSDQLCEGLTTDREKVYALHEWVTENIYYDYPSLAGSHPAVPAQYVLDRKTYVCSGYTVLMQALCWAQKIPCVYIVGPTTNGYHAWNAVEIDGEWFWLDATWDTFNKYYGGDRWVKGDTRLDYFLCSTEFISTDHKASNSGFSSSSRWVNDVLVSKEVTYRWCYTTNGINANLPDQTAEETKEIIKQNNEKMKEEKPLEEQKPAEEQKPITEQKPMEKQNTADWQQKVSAEVRQLVATDRSLSDWARDGVGEAFVHGLAPTLFIGGYNKRITREEFCGLMVQLVEQVSTYSIDSYTKLRGLTYQMPFVDTQNSMVGYAATLGIVGGRGAGIFAPEDDISRQEAAVMLMRTAQVLGLTPGEKLDFRDTQNLESWAKEGVDFVSGLVVPSTGSRVMNGTGNGTFSPFETYTREQAILTALALFNCVK